jgi:hypothetical protein
MRSLAHRVSATRGNATVGLDYDRAGDRYRAYADGDADKLYDFDGQYAYGDREIWRIVGSTLNALRAKACANSPCSIWAAVRAPGFGALSIAPDNWVLLGSPRVVLTLRRRRLDARAPCHRTSLAVPP